VQILRQEFTELQFVDVQKQFQFSFYVKTGGWKKVGENSWAKMRG